jgi:hypothetical protein
MNTRSKDIIFLLGAGASVEAKIPMSGQMISQVEELLSNRSEWQPHRDLYNHVKSAIYFSAGLQGLFNYDVPFNIETLVNTLYELERNEDHPLYPFIAAWNSRFVILAGEKFVHVRAFRRKILATLKRWMCPGDTSLSDYYIGLKSLQNDLNYALRVFSLNYDMCVERLNGTEFKVETGFEGFGVHPWSFQRFEEVEDGSTGSPELYLYKLHGSINWMRDPATKSLLSHEQIESVDDEHLDVIFGRDFKLEAADPYLFYAYEFRRYTLAAKLIVSIGYGFGDGHINKMLTQSLRNSMSRRILVVQNFKDDADMQVKLESVRKKLELDVSQKDQVVGFVGAAKAFLTQDKLSVFLTDLLPRGENEPF